MSIERYSAATQSGNLAMDWRTRDVDWLAAAGAIGIGRDPLPALVARWIGGDARTADEVVDAIERRYAKKHMGAHGARADILGATIWWGARTCSDCGGRGHRQIAGAPAMHDAACESCGGTGLARHASAGRAYTYALRELDSAAATCGRTIRRKVG